MLTANRVSDEALPGALAADELCAAARLAGFAPLPAFEPGWAVEDAGPAGAVAVRALLARGLATVGEPPALTPAARSALEPLLDPDAVLEIQRDESSGGRRRHMLAEAAGRRVLAAERTPSIWDLTAVEEPAGAVVYGLAEPLIPDSGRVPTLASGRLTPSGRALARADTLLAQGGAARLPQALQAHGLDEATAHALATVLSSARVLVTVRAARRTGGGPGEDSDVREAGAVTWLDAGDAGLWQVTPAAPEGDPDGDDGPEDADDAEYTFTAADAETVRDALAVLLGATDTKEERCLTS